MTRPRLQERQHGHVTLEPMLGPQQDASPGWRHPEFREPIGVISRPSLGLRFSEKQRLKAEKMGTPFGRDYTHGV